MKFSKHYEDAYKQLPSTWPLFINYKILKKSIRKIVNGTYYITWFYVSSVMVMLKLLRIGNKGVSHKYR